MFISTRKLFPQTGGQIYGFEGEDWDSLPVSMETMGCWEKPLPGDDGGTTVGWSNKVEADLPWPGPLLGVRTPNDTVEGGRAPATAFRRGRVIWLKGRQKQKHTERTGNSITLWLCWELSHQAISWQSPAYLAERKSIGLSGSVPMQHPSFASESMPWLGVSTLMHTGEEGPVVTNSWHNQQLVELGDYVGKKL